MEDYINPDYTTVFKIVRVDRTEHSLSGKIEFYVLAPSAEGDELHTYLQKDGSLKVLCDNGWFADMGEVSQAMENYHRFTIN